MKQINPLFKIFLMILATSLLSSCLLEKNQVNVNVKRDKVKNCKNSPSEKNCLMYEETFNYPDGSNLEVVSSDNWKRLSY